MDPVKAYQAEIVASVDAAQQADEWNDVLRRLDAATGERRAAVERDLRSVVYAGISAVRANRKAPVREDTRKELDGLVKALEKVNAKVDALNPYARSSFDLAHGTDAADAQAAINDLLDRAKSARQRWSGTSFRRRGTPARAEIIKLCWWLVKRNGMAETLPRLSRHFRNLCNDVLFLCGDDADDDIGGLIRQIPAD
jgi:hypothetical protein